jgi:hypothetical protein
MYASIRQYRMSPAQMDEAMHIVDTELADQLAEEPGFVAYELMGADDGTLCSMTIFEERSGAERAQEMAAEFVRESLADIDIERTMSSVGEIMVSRARERVLEAAHH